MAKRKAHDEQDTLELGGEAVDVVDADPEAVAALRGDLDVPPGTVVELHHQPPLNARLQLATDAVGTWLMLIADDGTPIPLTCYGPDRAHVRDQVAAIIDRGD